LLRAPAILPFCSIQSFRTRNEALVAERADPAFTPTYTLPILVMMFAIVRPFRRAVHALLAFNSSNQLAVGFAVGMIIGLVPKGNLIALSLCVLLFSLRCNKGIAIVAALLFSCIASWADPFSHRIGAAALNLGPLQATYASAYSMPLGPWLGFNNTVVAGSLLLGLYTSYPVYYVVGQICSIFRRPSSANHATHTGTPQPGGEA
jgi:uncharacterized protein (TIGR03546 family)